MNDSITADSPVDACMVYSCITLVGTRQVVAWAYMMFQLLLPVIVLAYQDWSRCLKKDAR